MAEIQQFNLRDLVTRAEGLKGMQQQNRLRELLMPLQQRDAQLSNQKAEMENAAREAQFFLSAMGDVDPQSADPQAINQSWMAARNALAQANGDIQGLSDQFDPQQFQQIKGLARLVPSTGVDASTRNFQYLTEGLSPEDVELARRIELGLDPRAVGSSSITIARDNLTDVVAGSQGKIKEEEGAGSERGKGSVKTRRGLIDDGLDAISQIPTLTRTLELLDEVETGGIQSRAGLALKQQFGIEGADEGELSANLGKAILGQLRSTFGAQFTEREGARLERIEAGFGKSTETNKRLIRAALDTVIRTARRGLRAAEQDGDDFAAEEIRNAIASLEEQREAVSGGQQAAQPAPQGAAPQAGGQQRMRYNPETGDLEPVG